MNFLNFLLLFSTGIAHAATNAQDLSFFHESAQGDIFEVQLAHVALQRATSQKARQFAEQMIRDHTKSLAELRSLARSRGFFVPTETSDTLKNVIRYFQISRAADWDYDYVTYEVADHEGDIAGVRKEIQQGSDEAIKANARQELPILESHLALARAAARSLAPRDR